MLVKLDKKTEKFLKERHDFNITDIDEKFYYLIVDLFSAKLDEKYKKLDNFQSLFEKELPSELKKLFMEIEDLFLDRANNAIYETLQLVRQFPELRVIKEIRY